MAFCRFTPARAADWPASDNSGISEQLRASRQPAGRRDLPSPGTNSRSKASRRARAVTACTPSMRCSTRSV